MCFQWVDQLRTPFLLCPGESLQIFACKDFKRRVGIITKESVPFDTPSSCSPHNFKIEPFYKDLGVLYDLAVLLKDASIGHNPIQTLLN